MSRCPSPFASSGSPLHLPRSNTPGALFRAVVVVHPETGETQLARLVSAVDRVLLAGACILATSGASARDLAPVPRTSDRPWRRFDGAFP